MPESDKSEVFKALLAYGTLGLEMGLSVAIGIGIGYFLDSRFGTSPILSIIFLLFGIAAGLKRLYEVWKKAERESEDETRDTK
jgi:F0F1-type ATP synthase assembly protein I